jgi:NitT/TauT family transport system permease protein
MALTTTTQDPEAPEVETSRPVDVLRDPDAAGESGKWVLRIFLFGLFFGVWQLAVELEWIREIILPKPSGIFTNFIETVTSTDILPHLSVTLQECMLGFVIGSGVGLLLAVIVALAPKATFVLRDYVTAFQSIPKVVFIPILITWFGFDMASKVVLAAMISFFPVYITSVVGMSGTPAPAMRLMTLMKANRFERLYKLQFLHALPTIFAGLKNAFTASLVGAIVGEFFGAKEGLGYLIVVENHALRIPEVFSVIIILSLLGVVGYTILDWVGKRICFWMPHS